MPEPTNQPLKPQKRPPDYFCCGPATLPLRTERQEWATFTAEDAEYAEGKYVKTLGGLGVLGGETIVPNYIAALAPAGREGWGSPAHRSRDIIAIPMPLSAGTRLGPYEIVAPAGAGGMGEVYRARDARLERVVAVKVLPEAVAGDADRLRRFEHEARAVAALNHPNILSIHDTGAHDGTHFLVTEFLEGESLRQRLEGGPLPARKAVDYALQLARGLAAAHEKGIAHRDLKPDNIFLTRDGRVKILDFGLAKLRPAEAAAAAQATVSAAPPTSPGTVMGTVGYMSPEQVRGKPVDHRSDIFSLGTILYEMLSGKRAFRGESAADTMSAILREEPPDLTETNRNLPPGLERIVRHCLEKNPEERFQSAHDIAFALESLSDIGSSSGAAAAAKVDYRPRLRIRMAFAIAAVAVALAVGTLIGLRLTGQPSNPSFHPITFRLGSMGDARFTPDGETVYSAAWDGKRPELYVARQGSPGDRNLGLQDAEVLSVSRGGELAILTGITTMGGNAFYGTLGRVSLSGGAPRPVLDAVQYADWSADGKELAITRYVPASGNWRIEFPIGKVLYDTVGWVSHPRISPQGDRIAFLDHPAPPGDDRGDVAVMDLAGHKKVLSTGWASVQGLVWHSAEELWFTGTRTGTSRALYAVTLSGKERPLLSAPANLMLQDVNDKGELLMKAENHRVGVLGMAPGETRERELAWFNWSLLRDITPDGKTVLLEEEGDAGGSNYLVYVRKTDGSPAVRLGEGNAWKISPDQQWVLTQLPGGGRQLRIIPTGTGEAREITHDPMEHFNPNWLPDSKHVMYVGVEPGHGPRSYILDINTGQSRAVTPEGIRGTILSPDGKLMVVVDSQGKSLIWPLAGGDPKPVAGLGENERIFAWTGDGRSLYISPASGPDMQPRKVYVLDPASGKRQLWKTLAPPDLTGIVGVAIPRISADGRAYAYTYVRALGDLYVIDGVK